MLEYLYDQDTATLVEGGKVKGRLARGVPSNTLSSWIHCPPFNLWCYSIRPIRVIPLPKFSEAHLASWARPQVRAELIADGAFSVGT